MKHARTVVGLMSLVVVLALSVALQGQRAGKPPTTTTTKPIPLTVTFCALDEGGQPYALRGHGGGDVTYVDRTGGTDAYIQTDGDLWFILDCRRSPHLDVSLSDRGMRPVYNPTPPASFEDMTTVRITTVGVTVPAGVEKNFTKLAEGTTQLPLVVQFWTPVDEYAWSLRYDWDLRIDPDYHLFSQTSVDVTTERAGGKNFRWTLTPTASPRPGFLYGEALFEKYVHHRPQPGYYIDYGTWVMPFKIVLEAIQ